jgi:hypothetical protein
MHKPGTSRAALNLTFCECVLRTERERESVIERESQGDRVCVCVCVCVRVCVRDREKDMCMSWLGGGERRMKEQESGRYIE